MVKTITLNDVKIISWSVHVEQRCVTVEYTLAADDGTDFSYGAATFWETMPDPVPNPMGGDEPDYIPEDWYQLPAKYTPLLTDLTVDARNALIHLLDE